MASNVPRLPNLRLGAEGAQAASVTGRRLQRRAAQPPGAGKRFSYANKRRPTHKISCLIPLRSISRERTLLLVKIGKEY